MLLAYRPQQNAGGEGFEPPERLAIARRSLLQI
ncbi:MAG: hypothetical protein ACI9CA_001386, partial [Natronomonas sp.]